MTRQADGQVKAPKIGVRMTAFRYYRHCAASIATVLAVALTSCVIKNSPKGSDACSDVILTPSGAQVAKCYDSTAELTDVTKDSSGRVAGYTFDVGCTDERHHKGAVTFSYASAGAVSIASLTVDGKVCKSPGTAPSNPGPDAPATTFAPEMPDAAPNSTPTNPDAGRMVVQPKVITEVVVIDHQPELRGTDRDGNGVRDDIDQVILNYGPATSDRGKLVKYAHAIQQAIELEGSATDAAVLEAANRIDRTMQCILKTVSSNAAQQLREIEALSINTRERVGAYFQNFERRISGAYFAVIADPCNQ